MKNFSIMKTIKSYSAFMRGLTATRSYSMLACGLTAVAFLFAACDNYFDEKYMDNGDPQKSVVTTIEYTLTSDDYKTIADNKTNRRFAADLDSVGETDINVPALALVGEKRCFNDVATADQYVPAFIYSKYPQFDPGSTCNITYLIDEGQPAYLERFNQTIQYELKAKDYKNLYGDDTNYLTPANESQVTQFLPMVDDDYLCGVRYNFAEAVGAPVTTKEVLYLYKDGVTWEVYSSTDVDAHILPASANGQAVKWLQNTYPYAVADQVVVLMTYDTKTKLYVATEYVFDGTTWNANTGIVEETMSFMLGQGWAANLSTYYKQAVAGEGNLGKILLFHYDLEDGISYIWRFDNLYGMRGSAYVGGPHYGEGWFVTPKIRLKNATEPVLLFDHALNYGPLDETREQQVTVWVSTDFVDDARSATWTQLPWNKWNGTTGVPDANSWTYYSSGAMDLSRWNNQTIYIGFRYKTEAGQTCPTWEVKNILVEEHVVEEQLDN